MSSFCGDYCSDSQAEYQDDFQAASQADFRTKFRVDLPAQQIHSYLVKALEQLQRAEQNALLWFAEIMQRDLYRELGHSSIQQYASEALGFSQNKTYQFIRLASSLQRMPLLHESVAKGEIGWTKAREVVKVATLKTQGKWIHEAKRCSKRQLEQKVTATRKCARSVGRRDPDQQSLDITPAKGSSVSTRQAFCMPGFAETQRPDMGPALEIPVTVTLRFTPEQLARYEALLERIEKVARIGNNGKDGKDGKMNLGRGSSCMRPLSREELHLAGLEDHLVALEKLRHDQNEELPGKQDSQSAENPCGGLNLQLDAKPDENRPLPADGSKFGDRLLPRGKSAPPYQIII